MSTDLTWEQVYGSAGSTASAGEVERRRRADGHTSDGAGYAPAEAPAPNIYGATRPARQRVATSTHRQHESEAKARRARANRTRLRKAKR